LETVEQVRKWETLHREIIASHRSALSFLRQWTHYAERLLYLESKEELKKEYTGNGEPLFEEFFASMLETHEGLDRTDQFFQLTDILSDKDPIRENWAPENLWKAAKLLHFQGRHDDARRFMQKGYELLEGSVLDVDRMGEYFKDWGEMTGSPDLCVMTDFQEALTYLDNAARYLGNDHKEIRFLKDRVISNQAKLFENASIEQMLSGKGEKAYLLALKNKAERALFEQDIPGTFSLVEELVWKSLESFPGTAIPHLLWLTKTASDCLNASDPQIASASEKVLNRIVAELPRLVEKRISFPREFLAYMAGKGIKFSMAPSDNQTEQE
jgi:tetratricopeptide (TPR) repeat protein